MVYSLLKQRERFVIIPCMMGIYDVSMSRMLGGFNYVDLIEGLVKDDGMLVGHGFTYYIQSMLSSLRHITLTHKPCTRLTLIVGSSIKRFVKQVFLENSVND